MVDLLLVEDNVELANLLCAFLKKEGFSLYHTPSGEEAVSWLNAHTTRLILLDIMLEGMDGFAVCQSVRQEKDIPILILSARSTKEDQLMGFELGADDYLEKPIDPQILCAKVKALLNRTYGKKDERDIVSKDLRMDVHAHKVYKKGVPLELNVKEFELLKLFLLHPHKTLHKEYVFNTIWGSNSESEAQTLTVHIQMLRSKIEDDPRKPKRIQTVWGVGYRYEEI